MAIMANAFMNIDYSELLAERTAALEAYRQRLIAYDSDQEPRSPDLVEPADVDANADGYVWNSVTGRWEGQSEVDIGGGDGGGAGGDGSAFNPILLDPVDWFLVASAGSTTFALNSEWDKENIGGAGDTVYAEANGALVDLMGGGGSEYVEDGFLTGATAYDIDPALGDRVLFYQAGFNAGVYTITDLGSESTPWVLTRATDTDDAEDSALDYIVHLAGTNFVARTARYDGLEDDFGTSSEQYGFAVYSPGNLAIGPGALSLGRNSVAIGEDAFAKKVGAVAIGNSASAVQNSVALGTGATATRQNTVAIRGLTMTYDTSGGLISGNTIDIDLSAGSNLQILELEHDAEFTANLAPNDVVGKVITIRINCDGSDHTLTFPGWTWVGSSEPQTITANSVARLTLDLHSRTTNTDADLMATWLVQNAEPGGEAITAQVVLNLIKTVDGEDSGLDAELLCGLPVTDFATVAVMGANLTDYDNLMLHKADNLNSLESVEDARINLGLGTVTGVATDAASIHAALVTLGLITA